MTRALALTQDTEKFLDEHVDSVEDLEILLLLRSEPRRDWDAVEVSRRIGLEPIAASNRLMRLYLNGVVTHPERAGRLFHFQHNRSKRLERALAELAEVFAASRMDVVTRIQNRQRKQLSLFSNAFHLGRDPKDG